MIPKIETGIPGLDTLLYGGIPAGRATLVAGKSGTSKSILSLQLACSMARAGRTTIVIAVEEAPDDLVTSGESLGFGIAELVRQNKLILSDLTRPTDGPTILSGEYDVSGLVHRVRDLVKQTGATALVLDSATALFSPRPNDAAMRSHFFALVSAFRQLGLTFVVTAEAPSDYGPLTTLGVEDFVCDCVITLRNLVDGERRRRTLEIHKYRRSPHYKGEYPCTITSKGMIIFPLDSRDREVDAAPERYPSGLEGLDRMTAGGWLRDSIILLRGPSGSGKTTLAGMYARAGALRGERVCYYGFEETRPVLMRNFRALGMPMEPLVESGNLQVECRYPEATSPEDMLLDMRASLDAMKPALVVLDSVSSIEHSTSPAGFRRFMIGLASLLREHARSALLTQTISQIADDNAAPYLSTIPDAILLLDYTLDAPEMVRTIRVLKMRGSAHETRRLQLKIDAGGLQVLPYEAPPQAHGR